MTARHTADTINDDDLDQLYATLDRIRHLHRPVGVVAAAEAGIAPDCAGCHRAWPCQTYNALDSGADNRADKDAPTIANPQANQGDPADNPADIGFVPATSQHFADMPRSDADPLVIEPYRNDCNQPRWAFRCWGTDTCDGWLSLELTSERWAEVVRERHISEAHPELVATNADESARTTANNPPTSTNTKEN